MRVEASEGTRRVTYQDVLAKEPEALVVPIREVDTMESITCGFRQVMIDAEDMEVSCGAGYGNDNITVKVGERTFILRGSDLLRAVAKKVDPARVERFPADTVDPPA